MLKIFKMLYLHHLVDPVIVKVAIENSSLAHCTVFHLFVLVGELLRALEGTLEEFPLLVRH